MRPAGPFEWTESIHEPNPGNILELMSRTISFTALSDPECDSDLLLKCSSPEEEDDLLCEMQSKQDIQDINDINEASRDVPLIPVEASKISAATQAEVPRILRPPLNVRSLYTILGVSESESILKVF